MKRNKNKKEFSKILAGGILISDVILSIATLILCFYAISVNFTGSLPYLVSLIGIYNMGSCYVLGKYFDKAKVENKIKLESSCYPEYEDSV